jgi:hypothetical protein
VSHESFTQVMVEIEPPVPVEGMYAGYFLDIVGSWSASNVLH